MTREEFDKRYSVQPVPNGGRGFYIADSVDRCIAGRPYPAKYRAEGVLSFMRAHCKIEEGQS